MVAWLTFLFLMINGGLFSGGVLLLFKRKKVPGIVLLLLAIGTYVAFIKLYNIWA